MYDFIFLLSPADHPASPAPSASPHPSEEHFVRADCYIPSSRLGGPDMRFHGSFFNCWLASFVQKALASNYPPLRVCYIYTI